MTTREQAMQWWNDLDYITKNELFISYYGDQREDYKGLTGSEIEKIWRKEVKTENIYLNRLKEQYRKAKKDEQNLKLMGDYRLIRFFVLDTELLSFKDVELMEFEVNQSF